MRKISYSLAISFLIGLLLTIGIMPGLSHINQESINNNYVVSLNQTQQQSRLTEAQNLVRQGREYYQAEQYQATIERLKQAANIFVTLEASTLEAITRSNLALAYQQLGNWQEAKEAIDQSLTLLKFSRNLEHPHRWTIPKLTPAKLPILAQVINIYGRLEYFQGNPQKALASWQLATKIYQKTNNQPEAIASQINQVQALQALGLSQEAKSAIAMVQKNLASLPDNLKFKALISLGNVFRITGDLTNSEQFLQQGLAIAKSSNSLTSMKTSYLSLADTWYSWGNLERERRAPIRYEYFPWRCDINNSLVLHDDINQFYQKATNNYQQVLESEQSQLSITAIKAQLNLLKLLITTGQWSKATALSSKIQLSRLPDNRTKVYAQINFAKSLACLKQQTSLENTSWDRITHLITTAIQSGSDLQDKRAKSYATGNLGGLYEYFAQI